PSRSCTRPATTAPPVPCADGSVRPPASCTPAPYPGTSRCCADRSTTTSRRGRHERAERANHRLSAFANAITERQRGDGMSAVFSHGRLRLYLLKLLSEGPKHGYELIRLLENRFLGLYAPSAGT